MPELPEMARRLLFFLGKAGKSRVQFAAEVGVTTSAVSYWLTGEHRPTYERLEIVCRVLGIDVPTFWGPFDDLLDGESDTGDKSAAG